MGRAGKGDGKQVRHPRSMQAGAAQPQPLRVQTPRRLAPSQGGFEPSDAKRSSSGHSRMPRWGVRGPIQF